jgi:2-polyprenyl-3-methyl-5-hydroxy-6-metoxy-1,4-benzoquinol methylase
MTEESYNEFYKEEYRKLYGGQEAPDQRFFEGQVFQGRRISNYIRKNWESDLTGMRVFEVGCGAGGILKHFRDLGCIVQGCDLDSDYLEYGKKEHQLDLINEKFENIQLKQKQDIVIYSHVFEHIPDINKEISSIRKSLKKDGVLFIEVPGIKNIENNYRCDFLRYLQNAHVYHFTLQTLVCLMEKNHFVLGAGSDYIQSIFFMGDEDSPRSSIKNQKHIIMDDLRRLESKRRLYRYSLQNIRRVAKLKKKRLARYLKSISVKK